MVARWVHTPKDSRSNRLPATTSTGGRLFFDWLLFLIVVRGFPPTVLRSWAVFLLSLLKKMEIEISELTSFAAMVGCGLIATLAAVLIDLWAGVDCARRRGEPIMSNGLRRTITKLGDYWRVQAFGIVADVLLLVFFTAPYLTILITLGEVLIEFRSVLETYKKTNSPAKGVTDAAKSVLDTLTAHDLERLRDFLKKKDGKTN